MITKIISAFPGCGKSHMFKNIVEIYNTYKKRKLRRDNMIKTKVISAFPACGKSHMFKNNRNRDMIILDSDSSEFSWLKDIDGNNTDTRNPDFPNNYIEHIKSNIGIADIIFVSSHDVVRHALRSNGIEYTLVYPDRSLKKEWVDRFIGRGNNVGFIKFISDNWDKFIDEIENDEYPHKVRLPDGETYIKDVITDTHY